MKMFGRASDILGQARIIGLYMALRGRLLGTTNVQVQETGRQRPDAVTEPW